MNHFLAAALLIPASGAAAMDVSVEESSRTTTVQAAFASSASCSTAWNVLTDYEHIDKFVGSMKESRVVASSDGALMVSQRARAGFLFVKRTVSVLLAVTETPKTRIAFSDQAKKDFVRYEGHWRLEPSSAGCAVEYMLAAERRFDAPQWATKRATRGSVGGLLQDVAREIERRSKDGEQRGGL